MQLVLVDNAHDLTDRLFSVLRADLNRSTDTDKNFHTVIRHLLWFIDDRTNAMFLLAKNGRLWDVDIIGRTFQEALVRFLFLCYSDSTNRKTKLREFSVDLWNIHEMFRAEQAKQLINTVGTIGWRNALEPLMLPTDEIEKLHKQYSNKTREALKQKWSFTGMLAEISKFSEAKYGAAFTSLMHQRSISSHFVHADETALSIMWDRANRSDDEREKLIDGHFARVLSDLLWLLVIARSALVYALKLSDVDDKFKTLVSEIHELTQELIKMEADFWESQQDFVNESKRRNLGNI